MGATETAEHYLTVQQVAARYGVIQDTVYRWHVRGVRVPGRDGRVRLRMLRVGWNWRVTPEDLDEFIAACNPGLPPREDPEPPDPAEERLRRKLGMDRRR